MTDIPNYITLILGTFISIQIVVHQSRIIDFFSRRNEKKLLRKKEKALSVYRETYRLKNDQSYYLIRITKMQLEAATYGVTAIAALCAVIYLSSIESLHITCRIANNVNLNCVDIFRVGYFNTLTDFIPKISKDYFGLIHFFGLPLIAVVIQFSLIMFIMACVTILTTIYRLEHFDEFESKLKQQWPDAFESAESPQACQVVTID